mgnify:CR=1 FL=1
MAGSTANPRIWSLADVYAAPIGTTGPTNIATALNAGFLPLGLTSEDGFEETLDNDVTRHHARGGILVRTTKSKHQRQIKVTALEENVTVWGLVNPGSGVASASGITTRTVKRPTANPMAFVIQETDGSITRRRYIPRGEVTEVGAVTSNDDQMSMYELTIDIYAAADGTLYLDITDDPQAVPA